MIRGSSWITASTPGNASAALTSIAVTSPAPTGAPTIAR